MRAYTLSRHVMTWVLIVLSTLAAPGCEKIKKVFKKPAPEGMTRRSFTVPLNGYQNTVDVKAPLPEVMRYVTDPSHFIVKLGESKGPLWEGDRPEVGASFPASARFFGVEFKGRFIIVKSEEHKVWMVFDNPYAFLCLRWNFDQVKGGTRLSFKTDYEIPGEGEAMGKVVDFSLLADRGLRNFDLTLARLQANFDPALDPEKLVEKGLRGEAYQSLLQVYETEVWVDAPPARVEKWVTAPEHMTILFPELQSDPERVADYGRSAVGSVTYVPATFQSGLLRTKMDCFAVKMGKGEGPKFRVYVAGYGIIVVIEMYTRPEAGRTMLKVRTAGELPASLGSEGMDIMLFVSGIPRMLQERTMLIKTGVEAAE